VTTAERQTAQQLRELGAIAHEDIIGPGEIRDLAGGVTRATFKLWRDGKSLAGAGPFPQPIRTVEQGELFDRQQVLEWLEARG
jgi:hypothetical protein